MATSSSQHEEDSVDLLMIGKTGHGKSSSANSILGREAFQESDGCEAETFMVQVGWARRLGRVIKVVDSPGLCETRMEKNEAKKKAAADMEKCIWECPHGFHALLLVLKYGNRFTEEELETVKMLKMLFGDTFVRDYCILIFTHGDCFDSSNRRTPKRTFSMWCQEQKGPMKDLLTECNYKAILFYNRTEEKLEPQLKELLALVDRVSKGGVRYTNEAFRRAAEEREKMIVRMNAPKLREEIQCKINLLVDGMEKLKQCEKLDEEAQNSFNNMKKDCKSLLDEIKAKDKGTGVLDSLRDDTTALLQSIASKEDALKEKDSEGEFEAAKVGLLQHLEMLHRHMMLRQLVTNIESNPTALIHLLANQGFLESDDDDSDSS